RAAEHGAAVAIERDPARAASIARNAAALGAPGLAVVQDEAPAALTDLPPPDAVFIGGGLAAEGRLAAVWAALPPGGRLVANAVTAAGELRLLAAQQAWGGDLVRIAVSRAEPAGPHQLWRALAPVTQWAVVKPH